MRVLVISAWDPRRVSNGACLVLHHHLHQLAASHDLRVITPDPSPAETPDLGTLPEGVELLRAPGRLPRGPDFAARRLRSRRDGEPAHVHWVERPGVLAELDRTLRQGDADLVHLFGRGTARLAARTGDVPCVHMPIDPWALGLSNRRLPTWRRRLERRERERVAAHERRWYPWSDAVVVVSDRDAEWLRAHVPDARVEVVPNGVEPRPPLPPSTEPLLGFHGVMDAEANLDAAGRLLDEVLPRVRAVRPDAGALVIGPHPPDHLRARTDRHVEITGWVDDLAPWLARVAVYAAPMQRGSGMKNKILEAMAASRPVVGTPMALAGIGAGPGVVEAAGVDEIAAQVVAWLDDPAGRAAAGEAARRRVVTEFTWERSAARLERLWTELASR